MIFNVKKYKPLDDTLRKGWTIQQLKNIPAGLKILDAGAGECFYKQYCTHLNYVAQDFCQYDGFGDGSGIQQEQQRNNSQIDIVSDITHIPVPNDSFDVVLCTEVLEHVPDPVSAIKEFDRILRKDGIMILTTPFSSYTHQAPYHFYSGLNRYFYQHWFSENYDIEILQSSGNWFELVAFEINILRGVIEKYTTKKMNLWDRFIKGLLTMRLKHYSRISKNADELGCLGYFVVAKKIKNRIY
ncbi:MAG: class I SAM-dependent methyltransferase [Bacteroidales bacterium]|jgi:ubiquinone/menaquinone biosynthesis C-methylase UbiE|nr:class I SAM-dependent methyltransferase [Bacteroidales bacterium]